MWYVSRSVGRMKLANDSKHDTVIAALDDYKVNDDHTVSLSLILEFSVRADCEVEMANNCAAVSDRNTIVLRGSIRGTIGRPH